MPTLTSCKTECTLSFEFRSLKYTQTVSTENPPVCNNKTPVLSYTKRSKKKKSISLAMRAKLKVKHSFACSPIILLYILYLLFAEKEMAVSQKQSPLPL